MDIQKGPKIQNSHSFNHIRNEDAVTITTTIDSAVNAKTKANQIINDNSPSLQKPLYEVQQEEDERKTSLKRGPPRINSNKLPPAFSNPVITQKNRQQKVQVFSGNKNMAVQRSTEINKLDNQEVLQEYKSDNHSPVKKQEENVRKRSKDKTVSKNPLAPLRHFMKNQQKIHEELGLNLSQVTAKNEFIVIQGALRLEEMITLDTLGGQSDSSPVKKVLHAPTLKIYVIKEVRQLFLWTIKKEALQNREMRQSLKDWVSFWQNRFSSSYQHVKVHSTFWNSPEGYVSILMEHMGGGSLQNLFESVGYLPEKAIRQIGQQVLQGLQRIHNAGQYCHGALGPSQVLFGRDGQVKLSLGTSYRTQQAKNAVFNALLLGKQKDQTLYDPVESSCLWTKGSVERIQYPICKESFNLEKANDVWKLGLLILSCAIGTLEFHPKAQELYEGFRMILEEMSTHQEQLKDACCILHSEEAVIALVEKKKERREEEKSSITLERLLNRNRYSSDFVNFLCGCLKIDPRKRSSLEKLGVSQFLQNKMQCKGPQITLKELITISSVWNSHLPDRYLGQGQKKLDRLCDALQLVLSSCDNIEISRSALLEDSNVIREIAFDLGISSSVVSDRITAVFSSYSKKPY